MPSKLPRPIEPPRGHIVCPKCDGVGFLARGAMPDREFFRCADCNGAGELPYAPHSYVQSLS